MLTMIIFNNKVQWMMRIRWILWAYIFSAVYFLHPFTVEAQERAEGVQKWRSNCQNSFSAISLTPIKKASPVPPYETSTEKNIAKAIENANLAKQTLITVPFSFFKWPLYITGMSGLLRYAKHYFEGDIEIAYNNMKYSLQGSKLWSFMKWKKFYGSVDQYHGMKNEIADNSSQQLNKMFWTQRGLILLADIGFKGYIHKAYDSAVAIVGETEVQVRGWKKFYGHFKEYQEHALWVYFYTRENNSIARQARGVLGLERIANKLYKGDKNITYINVRAVLTVEEFEQLGWEHFTPNEDAILLRWDFLPPPSPSPSPPPHSQVKKRSKS